MPASAPRTLRFAELELDRSRRLARIAGRKVELTPIEYQLLELFMLNPGPVLGPKEIYESVWGYDFGPSGNTLRVYIGYLSLRARAFARLLDLS